jgi:anti-anti-sigma factor
MFELTTSSTGTLQLVGEIDMSTADQLDSALAPAVSEGGPVMLDISNLEFMDSSALHAILNAASSLTDRGCIVIHGLDGSVSIRKLFEITQIEQVRNIHVIPCTVLVDGS